METILSIKNPNIRGTGCFPSPGLIQIQVGGLTLDDVARRYSELGFIHSQLGLDEAHTSAQGLKLLIQRQEEAEAIIASASMQDARKFMRRGVPPSLRCRIWRLACGFSDRVNVVEEQYLSRLRYECDRLDLITDELVMHDLQTVLDDPRFFVFEVSEVCMFFFLMISWLTAG